MTNKGKARKALESKIRSRYSSINGTAKSVNLDLLTYRELCELNKILVRPEVMSLEDRVGELLSNRLVKVKIRTCILERLKRYAKRFDYQDEIELLDSILEAWAKKVDYGREWRSG